MDIYTRIEIHGPADDLGRVPHTRYWMTDYKPGHPDGECKLREVGQVFFSPLPDTECLRTDSQRDNHD